MTDTAPGRFPLRKPSSSHRMAFVFAEVTSKGGIPQPELPAEATVEEGVRREASRSR
jgi:hypothetical protein